MKLTNAAQMREMDSYVIEDLNVPGAFLMANAAEHVAAAALERLPLGGSVAVFCGVGNNGGDGIGAAAYLLDKGVLVRLFIIGDTEKLSNDSLEMAHRFNQAGGIFEPFSLSSDIEQYVSTCNVIIDAIFGIGIHSDLFGDAQTAVNIINNSSAACVISADIPSGVNADTGAIMGSAVWADITVTFSMAKPGHFIEPGCVHCGELRVCDIGIPHDIIEGAIAPVFAVTSNEICLPRRRPDTHKGNFGRCLIAAGSVGYTGAPALAARAASRMGAGLVYLGVPEPIYNVMAIKLDEEMPFPLPANSIGHLAANAAGALIGRAAESDVLLLGPGLGVSPDITELVLSTIRLVKTPIVLDADGLNAISNNIDILQQAAGPLILTPHPGEYLRLGGELSSGDRLRSAREFAHKHGCILVLKGHRTITAMPDGTAYINTTGGPSMAKGGSGDVLAGMIASLIGQKFPLREAVTTAVYIHGLAGDMCAVEFGEYSVTASDIITMLPKAVTSLFPKKDLR
ncbi:MAG: NAD(P)H-hydrate dehydratase [Oscillospiraceae bacterium]|nr:NAD(P)H-hydrate dehydratase [Oscillospiraceae bacterium]